MGSNFFKERLGLSSSGHGLPLGRARKAKKTTRRTVQGLQRPRALVQQRFDAGEARLYVVVALTVRSGACNRSGIAATTVVNGSRCHWILMPFFRDELRRLFCCS